MQEPHDETLWYKDAIVYALDVHTFQDSDGDGIGDFAGLISRLDYLRDLGVTCLWLLPFYSSPDRDNGYDVSDYTTIAHECGGLEGFAALRAAAAARGIRIITDLVVQHTSNEHPWFRASRAGDPAYRDYYVWTAEPPAKTAAKQIFPGVEDGIWAWDDARAAYYLHQFYAFEPDLNVGCTGVQGEVHAIVQHWLDLGADGFRIDAASMALGDEALLPEPISQPFRFMRHLRTCVNDHPRGGVLMAEGSIVPERLGDYFGGDHGVQMLFNFSFPNELFLAFAREEAEPIVAGLERLPTPPEGGQWLDFLRNLDELNLDQLSDSERREVYRVFAPDLSMRIYGRGIRRRLAPMLQDRPRIELAFSLLLTMPGTPVIPYGDEIGMGEDLRLPERNSVRTVMQWSAAPNAGFSTGPSAALTKPVIAGGPFGYERVNVAAQTEDPGSLLNWLRRAIAARKRLPELGHGDCRIIPSGDRRVVALARSWQGEETLAVHNLSHTPVVVAIEAGLQRTGLRDHFADQTYPESQRNRIELGPYGYRWLRTDARPAHDERSAAPSREIGAW